MASLSQDPVSKTYRIHLRYGGKQFPKSLKTTDETEAQALKTRIALTLRDLETGRLAVPAGADWWEFVFSDGKRYPALVPGRRCGTPSPWPTTPGS